MSQLDSYQLSLLKSIRAQVKGVLEGIEEDGYSAGNLVFDYLTDASRMLESLYAYEPVPEPPVSDCSVYTPGCGCNFCYTREYLAKAKLESLRGENNGA